ncbi:MAG: SPOR domain-containing protein [Cellvibrionales bacterium]|nr:SPOR domain-containing protein [Cellvibrionales bacterium]
MCRILVAVALVCNVALALWLAGPGRTDSAGKLPPVPALRGERLVLLSELDPGQLRLREAPPNAPTTAPAATRIPPASVASTAATTASPPAPSLDSSSPMPTESGSPPHSSESPSPAPPKSSPPSIANTATLNAPLDSSDPPTPPPASAPPECLYFTYFDTRQAAEQLLARLEGAGLKAQIIEHLTSRPGAHRVYIEPFASRRAAEQALQALHDAQLTDSFVITENGRQNGISLGLFSDRKNALARQTQAQKLGYGARIERPMAQTVRFTVRSTSPNATALSGEQRLAIRAAHPTISMVQKACDALALARNFH